MKAYKSINDENDIRLFRPHLNMKRLSNSMERLCLPGSDFDHQELIDCIAKLVRLGKFVEISLFGVEIKLWFIYLILSMFCSLHIYAHIYTALHCNAITTYLQTKIGSQPRKDIHCTFDQQ